MITNPNPIVVPAIPVKTFDQLSVDWMSTSADTVTIGATALTSDGEKHPDLINREFPVAEIVAKHPEAAALFAKLSELAATLITE